MGTDTLHRGARPWPPLGHAEQAYLLGSLRPGATLPTPDPELDWALWRERAIGDGLGPLLYRRLRDAAIPEAVRQALRHSYYQNLSANHIRLTELDRLGRLLAHADIRLLVLKGGALARTVYEDPALRFMGDLDVAVPPRRAEEALRLLEADGYAVHLEQARRDQGATMRAFGWHVRLTRWVQGQQIELEVHWPLQNAVLVGQVARLDLAALWRSARPLDESANLWQPAAPAMLLHLCLHTGLQHRFTDLGLRHYLDIDRQVRAVPGDANFWPTFTVLAQSTRASAVSYFSLAQAAALLGTPLPADVMAALEPAAWQRRLFAARFRPEDAINRTRAFYGRRRAWWRLATTDHPADLVRGPLRAIFPSRAFLIEYYGATGGPRLWGYALWHPIRAMAHAGSRRLRTWLPRPTALKRNP